MQMKDLLVPQLLTKALGLLEQGSIKEAVPILESLGADRWGSAKDKIGEAYYRYGRILQQDLSLNEALKFFRKTKDIRRQDELCSLRIHLLQSLIQRNGFITQKLFLSEFAARLEIVSGKLPQYGQWDYLKYAEDLQLISPSKWTLASCPGETYILGEYHPWRPDHKWTRAIRHFKKDLREDMIEPLVVLMADFLFKRTTAIRDIDFIVPIPPSPHKYVARKNFSPNDLLGQRLAELVAVPCLKVLSRNDTAAAGRKHDMYYLDMKLKKRLEGRGIILVEDVTTSGETLIACRNHCIEAGPSSLYAIILGKTC